MPELLTSGNSVVFFILLYSVGMKYPIAIMQGRLSSDSGGRFQFFPHEWESEFLLAREMGFYGIEWICDWQEMEEDSNPLLIEAQAAQVAHKAQGVGIAITAVCADWYMKYDLRDASQSAGDWLDRAIEATRFTTEKRIVVPLLEKNAPETKEEERRIVSHLGAHVRLAQECGAVLAFETEMDVHRLISFIDSFQSDAVGVNYDIGNCTSYGFDCPSDILTL
jgi:sugar phosphate isomerase/epimerase